MLSTPGLMLSPKRSSVDKKVKHKAVTNEVEEIDRVQGKERVLIMRKVFAYSIVVDLQ